TFLCLSREGAKRGPRALCRVPPLVVLTLPFVNRGGTLPLCAARSRTTRPARPRSAYTEEGGASALAREPAGERGGGFRVVARSRFALARKPGERGGALPGVRPFAFGSSARALGSLAPVSWKGRRFCAFRFARCLCARTRGRTPTWSARPRSRGVRARKRGRGAGVWGARPFSSPRADPSFACGLCAQTGGAAAPPLALRARSPARGGRGGGGGAYLVPRRPSCSRVNEGAGGQRRGTYLSRAPCSCAPPPLARKRERRLQWRGLVPRSRVLFARERRGRGVAVASPSCANAGGVSLPAQPPVRESTGAGAVFGSPVRRERGRGRKGGAYLSRASFARIRGQGARGGRAPLQGQGRGGVPRSPALRVLRTCTGSGKGGQRGRRGPHAQRV
ncbi:hypothetical protein EDB84DRAFT_1677591, partial [Lactarius hengduanensis]